MKFGTERGSKIETLLAGAAIGFGVMMAARGAERLMRFLEERQARTGNQELQSLRDQLRRMQIQQQGAPVHGQRLYTKK
jgi:hypothetical protein